MWHGHMAIRSANLYLFQSFVYGRCVLRNYTQLCSVWFVCLCLMDMSGLT
jgi:hypothetical protein